MTEPFLTVYAVLDEETQRVMRGHSQALEAAGLAGTQSKEIPYHISLGSYPTPMLEELLPRMEKICAATAPFPVEFHRLGSFGDHVLFFQPETSREILRLRQAFSNDYPVVHPYYAHCTLLQDEPERVRQAREIMAGRLSPIHATVTGIEIGRFFPAERLRTIPFTGEESGHGPLRPPSRA